MGRGGSRVPQSARRNAARLQIATSILCLGLATLAPSSLVRAAAAPAPAQPAIVERVDPKSVEALQRMSAYLQALPAFGLTSQTSLDLVLRDGQKVMIDGVGRYKVRRPAGFAIDIESNLKARRFIYDGKQFTIFAPKLGYFATVAAPATNRETLDVLWTRYGIALPLEDLFRWSDPNGARDDRLQSGFRVGTVVLDGVDTEQYVFREPGFDWQIWIQTGDKPLPLKLVIVDRTDPSHPAYVARLTWDVSPTFADNDFAFRPDKDAKPVHISLITSVQSAGGAR